jgi:hypothetical protein
MESSCELLGIKFEFRIPASWTFFPTGLVPSGTGFFLQSPVLAAGFLMEAQRTPVVAAPLAVVAVSARVLLRPPVLVRDIEEPFGALHPNESHGNPLVYHRGKIKADVRLYVPGKTSKPFFSLEVI